MFPRHSQDQSRFWRLNFGKELKLPGNPVRPEVERGLQMSYEVGRRGPGNPEFTTVADIALLMTVYVVDGTAPQPIACGCKTHGIGMRYRFLWIVLR